jgi:streptogramin lyase
LAVVYGDNYVWIGASSGVIRLDPSSLAYTTYTEPGPTRYILPVTDEQVFAVSDLGIFYFDGQRWSRPKFSVPYYLDAQHMVVMGLTNDNDLFWYERGEVPGSLRGIRVTGDVPPRNGLWHATEDYRLKDYAPSDCTRNRMLAGAYRTSEECQRYSTARQQFDYLKPSVGLAAVDADGTFWVVNGNDRLANWTTDGSTLAQLTVPGEYPYPTGYTADPKHGVWLAGTEGLFRVDGTSVRRIPIGLEVEKYTLYPPGGVAVDTSGTVWVTTEHGLQRLTSDGQTWRLVDNARLAGRLMFNPMPARDGGLWLLNNDLLHFDGTTLITLSLPLPTNNRCSQHGLDVDPSGNVWLPNFDCSLLQFNPTSNQWQRHLPGKNIDRVSISADNAVYVLNTTGQLMLYSPAQNAWPTVIQLKPQPYLPYYSIAADNHGGVWIAAQETGELWRYQPGWTSLISQCRLPAGDSYLFVDQQNQLWVSTSSGLLRFDGHDWQTISAPISSVHPMATGPDGRVWFASQQGVAVYDPAQDERP